MPGPVEEFGDAVTLAGEPYEVGGPQAAMDEGNRPVRDAKILEHLVQAISRGARSADEVAVAGSDGSSDGIFEEFGILGQHCDLTTATGRRTSQGHDQLAVDAAPCSVGLTPANSPPKGPVARPRARIERP